MFPDPPQENAFRVEEAPMPLFDSHPSLLDVPEDGVLLQDSALPAFDYDNHEDVGQGEGCPVGLEPLPELKLQGVIKQFGDDGDGRPCN